MMQYGAVFPQTEFGTDPAAVRDYAQAVEALGFGHVLAYEHVLGVDPNQPGWQGRYSYQDAFFSPFLLFSFMAAATEKLEFVTGILILPQRQTALAAKQAATLDVLSGGRLRLGVAIGWNEAEYVALGQDFHTRGRRVEAQIGLLRRLWTEPLVDYSNEWDTIPNAGINPLPVQQPIPIWLGGDSERALRRAAQLADGWLPLTRSLESFEAALGRLDEYLEEAGRTRGEIGVEPRMNLTGGPDEWGEAAQAWEAVGATHLSVNTMELGLSTPQAHVDTLRRFAEVVGLA
jgi:probable F420-dependent oxidoreductase